MIKSTIKSIKIDGVKGVRVIYELKPFTAITGPNFSGKTAIADAIRLALIGYVPSLGKRNQSTMQLADGDTMSVRATFNDNQANSRKWTRTGKGVSLGEDVGHEWPAEILDIGVWLGATQAERIRMVAGASGASEELEKMVREFNGKSGVDTVEKLEAEITALKESLKFAKAQAKTYEQTLRGAADIDTDAAPVADAKGASEQARQKVWGIRSTLTDVQKELAKAEQADHAADDAAAQLAGIETLDAYGMDENYAREKIASIRHDLNVQTQTVHDLRSRLETTTGWVSKLINDIARLKAERDELEKDYAVRNGIQYPISGIAPTGEQMHWAKLVIHEAQEKLTSARAARVHAEADRKQLEDAFNGLINEPCCPTCKNNSEGWMRHARLFYSEKIDKAQEHVIDLTVAEDTAADELKAAQWQQTDLTQRAREHETVAKITRRKQINLEIFTAGESLKRMREKAAKHQADLDAATNPAAQADKLAEAERLERLIDSTRKAFRLQEIIKARPNADYISDFVGKNEDLQAALVTAVADEQSALAAEKAWIEQEERSRMMAEARTRYDAINEEMVQTNHQIDVLSGILLSQQEALWGSINRACKAFSDIAREVTLEVRNGEIGARNETGSWIPYDALSGSEQIMAAAAVQIALCERAPAKILMLDELSRMTARTKSAFADVLQRLLDEKVVDQVIVVDWDTPFWADHKNVHTLDIAA